MNPVTRFAVVTLVAIVLLIVGVLMNGPSETQAAQDVADVVAEAQAAAVRASRVIVAQRGSL